MDKMKKAILRERIIGFSVIFLLLILSWLFAMQPRLSGPNKISAQTEQEKQKLQGLIAEETKLNKAQATLPEKQKLAVALSQKFPSKANPAELTALVKADAESVGIPTSAVTAVTIGTPVQFVPDAATSSGGAAPPAATTPSSGSSAAAPDAKPTGAPAASTGEQIYTLSIEITVESSLIQLGNYINALKNGSRAVYVTATMSDSSTASETAIAGAGISPNGVYSNKLTAQTFLLPPFTSKPPAPVKDTPLAK